MGCVGELMTKGTMSCVVNIAAGKETIVPHEPGDTAPAPKRILVVGGGPAGLEFARTAALRGHKVELHEATKRLGGQAAMAATAPHREDVGAITSWLSDELERLRVEVHLNSLVDAERVSKISPDEVVIATGTTPRVDGYQVATPSTRIEGFDQPHVYTSWDLFGHGRPVTVQSPAVVFDDTGSFEAISVAELLLKRGARVTMVSRLESIGQNLPYPPVTVGAARERLFSGDFDFVGGHYLRRITATDVRAGVLFTDRDRAIPALTVVLVTYNRPNRELADVLAAKGVQVRLIGDVRGRNGLMSAIHGAANLGRII
jgi:NADPH-dependent 2,4-dienoyl-CoA reductase/sulfur reductase-like enzyme